MDTNVQLVETKRADPEAIERLKAAINKVSADIKSQRQQSRGEVAEEVVAKQEEKPKKWKALRSPREGYGQIFTEEVVREIHQKFIVEGGKPVAWVAANNGYAVVTAGTMTRYFQKYSLPYNLSAQEWYRWKNYKEVFVDKKESEETTVTEPEADRYSLLFGLMAHLPKDGEWTRAERNAFVAAHTAVVDLLTRVVEPDHG